MSNNKICFMIAVVCIAGMTTKAVAETPAKEPVKEVVVQSLDSSEITVDPKRLEEERKTNDAVSNFHTKLNKSKQGSGVYASRSLYEISMRKAAFDAIVKNLSVKRGSISQKIANQALLEAKSVFDPVFSLSLNTSKTRDFERTEHPDKFKKGSQLVGGNHQVIMPENSPVSYLQYNAERPEGYYETTVKASEKSNIDPDVSTSLSADLYQKLPWGNVLSVNWTTNYKDNKWVENDDVIGKATVGRYARPWTMSASAGVSLPLPFTNGFGENNADHTAINTARLSNRIALWNVRLIINNTLLQVDHAYWDIINTVQQLYNTTKIRKLAADLLKRTNRMYKLREITSADKAQVEAQYESIKATEEEAFKNYVTVSNSLHRLLDLDENVILTPVGYSGLLEEAFVEPEDSDAALDNPEYLMASLYVDTARLNHGFYENQTKPTLGVTGSIKGSQSNAVFGFNDYGDSFQHIFDPDQVVLSAGVAFSRPVFNDAAQAALFQANKDIRRQSLLRRQVSANLKTIFNTAKASLRSAEESIKIAKRNKKLAKSIYERALRFQKIRKVTEYEVTEKLISLLNAENAYVQAKTSCKKAESQLLASVGMLATKYGERSAQTNIDRNRVKVLAQSASLQMFGGSAE